MNEILCPRDCPDRCSTCHITCERYKEYKRKRAETLAEKYRINDADGAKIESVRRMRRIRRRRRE